MSDTPLISVVIPAYNHEKYIQETIQSIINQTYKNLELIVIDDGSKDTSWQKINEMKEICEKRFCNVIFETQINQGVCETLNKGYAIANGIYVYSLASDDLAKPEAIETLYNEIKTDQYVLVVGDDDIIDGNSKLIAWDNKRNPVEYHDGYKTFATYLQSKNKCPNFESDDFGSYESLVKGNYITNGFLIKKSDFDKIGGYIKEAPLEDWYMNLQLAKLGKFKFINQVLFSYRWHGANTITQTDKMKKAANQTILYEKKLVETSDNTALLDIFNKATIKTKYLIKLSPIISLYKQKNLETKKQ